MVTVKIVVVNTKANVVDMKTFVFIFTTVPPAVVMVQWAISVKQ